MHALRLFLRRNVVTRCLLLQAFILHGFKRRPAARRVLVRLITMSPGSFSAHYLLGRIHLDEGQRRRALQEFRISYHLDPGRFFKQRLGRGLREEVVLAAQIPPEHLTDGALREGDPLPGEWDDLLDRTPVQRPRLEGTDFSDIEEYERLRRLPPVTHEEVKKVDIDALIARLIDHPHTGTVDQG